MDADNQAFEAELQEARAQQQLTSNGPTDASAQTQAATTSQDPTSPKVNVFDYQVSSFENEVDPVGLEMQEKGGGLLSQSHNFVAPHAGGPGVSGSNDTDGLKTDV